MESTGKQGMMTKLRNRKGFSLVEMAIVLVIIGIIIGAVMKGQDLMTNSRAKQATTVVNTWKALSYAFLDRNGRLPGDLGKTGVLGSYTSSQSSIKEIQNTMANAPTNPISIGSLKFYVYFGQVPGLPTATSATRNVIALCSNAACTNNFTADELEIMKAIDTAQDGEANGTKGQFRAVKTGVTLADPTTNLTIQSMAGFRNYSSGGNSDTANVNTWDATDTVAAVWAFDRPF